MFFWERKGASALIEKHTSLPQRPRKAHPHQGGRCWGPTRTKDSSSKVLHRRLHEGKHRQEEAAGHGKPHQNTGTTLQETHHENTSLHAGKKETKHKNRSSLLSRRDNPGSGVI
eukprot:TRINITY_DN512_c0_g5_i3.p3 TRINITY_DN512_c0_g5~~TRINITY_DN512_c0_g5_i3.p3  ORF type:complete len:114 (-),score=16.59 TRINITY_DN512_c0_g5_i3:574-915(-)